MLCFWKRILVYMFYLFLENKSIKPITFSFPSTLSSVHVFAHFGAKNFIFFSLGLGQISSSLSLVWPKEIGEAMILLQDLCASTLMEEYKGDREVIFWAWNLKAWSFNGGLQWPKMEDFHSPKVRPTVAPNGQNRAQQSKKKTRVLCISNQSLWVFVSAIIPWCVHAILCLFWMILGT